MTRQPARHPASKTKAKGTNVTTMVTPRPAERDAQMRVGFVGAGKVGFTLGRHLQTHGVSVSGFFSRTPTHARAAATSTSSTAYDTLAALCNASDLLFLTVNDSQIEPVAQSLATCEVSLAGKMVCHVSGSLGSEALAAAQRAGALCCSAHPLAAVSSCDTSGSTLNGTFFTLEGDARALHAMTQLLDRCGNPHRSIAPEAKASYHAGCVFLSNLVVALAAQGYGILEHCGFTPEEARRATAGLFTRNAQAIAEGGPNAALTGPIERGDVTTVRRHLQALARIDDASDPPGNTLRTYATLSQTLCSLAQQNHPERSYEKIRTLLGKDAR